MNDSSRLSSLSTGHSRSPWNKDKIIGPRPPLRPGHVFRPLLRRFERLARLVGQFEPHRPTGFPLAHVGAVDCITLRRHVIDAQCHEIASAPSIARLESVEVDDALEIAEKIDV